jgi:hypothetical protein
LQRVRPTLDEVADMKQSNRPNSTYVSAIESAAEILFSKIREAVDGGGTSAYSIASNIIGDVSVIAERGFPQRYFGAPDNELLDIIAMHAIKRTNSATPLFQILLEKANDYYQRPELRLLILKTLQPKAIMMQGSDDERNSWIQCYKTAFASLFNALSTANENDWAYHMPIIARKKDLFQMPSCFCESCCCHVLELFSLFHIDGPLDFVNNATAQDDNGDDDDDDGADKARRNHVVSCCCEENHMMSCNFEFLHWAAKNALHGGCGNLQEHLIFPYFIICRKYSTTTTQAREQEPLFQWKLMIMRKVKHHQF